MNDPAVLRRLRWRCRRGMKELDLLLLGYLERNHLRFDAAERAQFEALLDQEDDVLWGWLLGRLQPEDPAMRRILEQIRAHAPTAT